MVSLNWLRQQLQNAKMHPVNPNHLDVIECWKGLSHTQALELAMWYQFLHESLHNEVKDSLSKDIVNHLLARSGKSSSHAAEEVDAAPQLIVAGSISLLRLYQL